MIWTQDPIEKLCYRPCNDTEKDNQKPRNPYTFSSKIQAVTRKERLGDDFRENDNECRRDDNRHKTTAYKLVKDDWKSLVDNHVGQK